MDPSASNRFFFVHVMKTAGTILAKHLKQQFPGGEFYPARGFDWEVPTDVEPYGSIPRLLSIPDERRAQIRIYAGHFPYSVCERLEPGLFTLTILRDPVDRAVSALKHFKRLDPRFESSTLEEIYETREIYRCYIENHQMKVFCLTEADDAKTIMRPVDVDAGRFELAKANLAKVDVIGLADDFGGFVDELRSRLGWWPEGVDTSDRANDSPRSWGASAELRQRIAADHPYEIEFYRYAVGLVADRRRASADAT